MEVTTTSPIFAGKSGMCVWRPNDLCDASSITEWSVTTALTFVVMVNSQTPSARVIVLLECSRLQGHVVSVI